MIDQEVKKASLKLGRVSKKQAIINKAIKEEQMARYESKRNPNNVWKELLEERTFENAVFRNHSKFNFDPIKKSF